MELKDLTPIEYQIYENISATEFKMQMACDKLGMYTIEELQDIQEEYSYAGKAVVDMIREDFQAMPPYMKKRMLKLLANDEGHTPQFWLDMLGMK